MNKKKLAIVTGILSVVLVTLNFIGTFRLCGAKDYGSCMDVFYNIIINLFPIIPLFIFSLITYKMREEVYQTWWKFARVWIPASMLAILIAPSYANNWMFPIEKGNVAAFFSLVFVVSSILIIASRYYSLKKNLKYSSAAPFGIFIIGLVLSAIIFLALAQIL